MVHTIGPEELEALVAGGGVDIVDVREPNEWQTGHIPGARLVPLDELKADPSGALPRDNVVFVCAKGGRSATAAKLAEKHGKQQVYSLDGGTQAWMSAGMPVIVPRPPKPRPERAHDHADDDGPGELVIPEPALDAIVGKNLAAHRERAGLTLDALAKQAGVSRQLLGQIELGRTVPSIGVVWKIAQTLGVPFSALLSTSQRVGTSVMKRAKAKRLLSADGRFSSRALFPFGDTAPAEFYELWLAPHGREDAEPHRPGTRENLIVTKGKLDLTIGTDKVRLDEGDAIVFAADVPHAYANPTGDECWMYLVMTYGV